MKDNLPHTYKVVFFGKPSDIKDIFGDEEINSLNSLSAYDFSYADVQNTGGAFSTGIQSNLTAATNLQNRNVVIPAIFVKDYYTYDTNSTNKLSNVSFNNVLKFNLKPAIKLKRIIEGIQTQYGVTFNMADEGSIKTFW